MQTIILIFITSFMFIGCDKIESFFSSSGGDNEAQEMQKQKQEQLESYQKNLQRDRLKSYSDPNYIEQK